jgi:16S rRNA (cytidine1402-2'-O)-methyltransferase
MATLYLVSTPIGNLGDLTRRASEILGSADRILAEDTRRTRGLLSHLGLSTPLTSLHEHNEASRERQVLSWLAAGEELALVSDAGTPLISDPGSRLVRAVAEAGHKVVPIPGPSAVLAALVASGLPPDPFSFFGFAPRKGAERAEWLDRVGSALETTVLFESPERLTRLLGELVARCGSDRGAVVAREITKIHEEFARGTLQELRLHFEGQPPRGEITLVLAPAPTAEQSGAVDEAASQALAEPLLAQGMPPSQVAREVARRLKISRNQAYRIVQELSPNPPSTE